MQEVDHEKWAVSARRSTRLGMRWALTGGPPGMEFELQSFT